jgi:hypothetical protein
MRCATCGLVECGHLRNDPKASSAVALSQIRQQLLLQPQPAAPLGLLVPNDPPTLKGDSND